MGGTGEAPPRAVKQPCVPPAHSQLPLVVSPEEGVRRGPHSEVTAPGVHQDIQLEKEEREGGSGPQRDLAVLSPQPCTAGQ